MTIATIDHSISNPVKPVFFQRFSTHKLGLRWHSSTSWELSQPKWRTCGEESSHPKIPLVFRSCFSTTLKRNHFWRVFLRDFRTQIFYELSCQTKNHIEFASSSQYNVTLLLLILFGTSFRRWFLRLTESALSGRCCDHRWRLNWNVGKPEFCRPNTRAGACFVSFWWLWSPVFFDTQVHVVSFTKRGMGSCWDEVKGQCSLVGR